MNVEQMVADLVSLLESENAHRDTELVAGRGCATGVGSPLLLVALAWSWRRRL